MLHIGHSWVSSATVCGKMIFMNSGVGYFNVDEQSIWSCLDYHDSYQRPLSTYSMAILMYMYRPCGCIAVNSNPCWTCIWVDVNIVYNCSTVCWCTSLVVIYGQFVKLINNKLGSGTNPNQFSSDMYQSRSSQILHFSYWVELYLKSKEQRKWSKTNWSVKTET